MSESLSSSRLHRARVMLLGAPVRRARKWAAGALALVAVVFAVLPADAAPGAPTLVAATDLPAGAPLTERDVRVVSVPPDARPRSALEKPAEAVGRTLSGGVAVGEPITPARLVGSENTRLAGGADSAAVPIRLADPAVADLLHPGARVEVLSADPQTGAPVVLAANATVLTIRTTPPDPSAPGRGRLVVLALPRETAATVAAVSMTQPVAVTLR